MRKLLLAVSVGLLQAVLGQRTSVLVRQQFCLATIIAEEMGKNPMFKTPVVDQAARQSVKGCEGIIPSSLILQCFLTREGSELNSVIKRC